uniref:Uncharacterized protein n=1 Tax=Pygocentrus nattereri TaxID=42514 RepID=A0A3B4CI71_PYGNA
MYYNNSQSICPKLSHLLLLFPSVKRRAHFSGITLVTGEKQTECYNDDAKQKVSFFSQILSFSLSSSPNVCRADSVFWRAPAGPELALCGCVWVLNSKRA